MTHSHRTLLAVSLFCCALFIAPARAADSAVAPAATPATTATIVAPVNPPVADEVASAAVIVMNREVMRFRAEFLGHSPESRAAAATERIEGILALGGSGQVTTAIIQDAVVLQLDGKLAFAVTRGDANPLLDQDRDAVAAAAVVALTKVAREHAEGRTQPNLATSLYVLGITVFWVAILFALGTVRRVLQRWASARAEAKAEEFKVDGSRMVDRDTVRGVVRAVLRLFYFGAVLLVTYEWLGLTLQAYPYTRPWGEQLASFLIELGKDMLVAVAAAAPGLFVVLVIMFVARGITSMNARFLDRVQRGEIEIGWVGPETAVPTRRLLSVVVWLFALAMAYPYLPGSGSQAFQGLSVLVGLMISLGGASSIGQAAAGLILMYGRSLKVGEYVRIGDQEGTVTEIGGFQTRLRTGMGVEVVIPNGAVIGSVVHNYSRVVQGKGFVIDVMVTIGYDAPWRQVHKLLTDAALATDSVLAEPKPAVFQTALSDFYVEYRLVCQATSLQARPRAEVMSALHANIQDQFNAAGVQIMSPHYFGDPATAKIVPKDQWDPK